jgi:hypothetical protein
MFWYVICCLQIWYAEPAIRILAFWHRQPSLLLAFVIAVECECLPNTWTTITVLKAVFFYIVQAGARVKDRKREAILL